MQSRRADRGTDAGIVNNVPVRTTGKERTQSQRAKQGPQPSKLQKILLQGDSSKSAAATITGGAKSARIPRRILSKNDDTSKNETAGFQGNNQGVIITEKTVPHSQESNKDAQVANGQSSGFIFSANGKAQIGGPYKNGPYARKYKWVRPTPPNSAQVTKKIDRKSVV